MNKKHIVAIEIGSSKVVGAVAEIVDSRIYVKQLEQETQTSCVNYGQVQNVENIKAIINRILHKIEYKMGGTVTQIFVGRSGRSLHTEPGEINRSIDATQSITQTTIDAILRDTLGQKVKRYENIEVEPQAFYVDKSLVTDNNPVGQYGNSLKIKYNLITASSSLLLNLDRVASNFKPKFITTILAMGKHIINKEEKRLGCMLVDMGAETTTVAIYKNDMLHYVNTLPLGGRNISLDIANGLGGVTEETAERVKKNINNPLDIQMVDPVVMEGINSKEAANYINARAGEIIANVNKQLEYANFTSNDITSIVLSGGASQLRGMAKKLEDTTKIPVRKANMPNSVNFDNMRDNIAEHIQIMSLIAEAARIIDPMDTCLKIDSYSDGEGDFGVQSSGETKVDETKVDEPKKPKEPKKTSIWDFFKKTLENNLMSEPEEDD